MRMRTAYNLHVQHVRHEHVGCIFNGASDFGRRVQAARTLTNETVNCRIFIQCTVRFEAALHIPCKLDRIDNFLIASTPANVATQAFFYLVSACTWILAQGRSGRHHHAWDAITALTCTTFIERLLQQRHA